VSETILKNENVWACLLEARLDELSLSYDEDVLFSLPGRNGLEQGRSHFLAIMKKIHQKITTSFKFDEMQVYNTDAGVVSIVRWTSENSPEGSLATIFRSFNENGKVVEERWFLDIVQWEDK
jgi:hypothetical protein